MSFRWTDREVRLALGLNPQRAREDLTFGGVSSDSRTVKAGDLFVALRGERFDGHDFVAEAVARGAAGAVVSRPVALEEALPLYPVRDTLEALGDLARHRRRALKAKVVGITGSSGKTTVKEMVREVLGGSFRVHATQGNLNNRVGLPHTLLASPADTQVLVLEMGTSEPGEIRALAGIGLPDLGVITTVGEAHLEKLGSVVGVLDEKVDLFRALRVGGVGVVGEEPPMLARRAREVLGGRGLWVVGTGEGAHGEFRARDLRLGEEGAYRFRWGDQEVILGVPGLHNVRNALMALAVGVLLGVPAREAARRLRRVRSFAMRGEVRSIGGLTVLVDCYNANPQSVRAALDMLVSVQRLGGRVAVLGSMLELGEWAPLLHRQVLEEALSRPLDLVVAIGGFAEAARWVERPKGGAELLTAESVQEAGDLLLGRLGGSEVVLLKASRGVALERLLLPLEERFGGAASPLDRERDKGSSAAGGPARHPSRGKED